MIFHKGDIASCMVRAHKHAADMHMVFIEHKFTPQVLFPDFITLLDDPFNEYFFSLSLPCPNIDYYF